METPIRGEVSEVAFPDKIASSRGRRSVSKHMARRITILLVAVKTVAGRSECTIFTWIFVQDELLA